MGQRRRQSDLLLINKIDLAELVGASVEVMLRDAQQLRGERPVVLTAIRHGIGMAEVVEWVRVGCVARGPRAALSAQPYWHAHAH